MQRGGAVCALALPSEVWIEVLSRLNGQDLARALCTCKAFSRLQQPVWQAACFKRWNKWSSYLDPASHWRRQYELLCLRELAEQTVADVGQIRNAQQFVSDRHRAVLVEWMCEIAMDWNLETAIAFKAVAYLDRYLSRSSVSRLARFQLVGIACLRTAMGDMRQPTALVTEKHMDAATFAYLSDDTYTSQEVEEETQAVMALINDTTKVAPNPKMFLRTFWYRAIFKGVARADDMHVYILASFLLQLSLLDLECSAYSASLLGASALSVALRFFGKPAWPLSMQQYAVYRADELEPCAARLAFLQSSCEYMQLRQKWLTSHENHGYEEHADEWLRALAIMRGPCALESVPPAIPAQGLFAALDMGPTPMEV
ncbi:hypothetical protein ACKKBG_A13050 [Auxenochlorella protothecoides x Auxenochlorella symbiontica]